MYMSNNNIKYERFEVCKICPIISECAVLKMDAAQQSNLAGNTKPDHGNVLDSAKTMCTEYGPKVEDRSKIGAVPKTGCDCGRLEQVVVDDSLHKRLEFVHLDSADLASSCSSRPSKVPELSFKINCATTAKNQNEQDNQNGRNGRNGRSEHNDEYESGFQRTQLGGNRGSSDQPLLQETCIFQPNNCHQKVDSSVKVNHSHAKQRQLCFLKSQSLDLFNEDGNPTYSTQYVNSATKTQLPNISENLSTDLQKPNLALKFQSIETRPIYPNVPYSPYGSPFGSPRSNRRRPPLRESRRISIERSGSFLQLNQYKLMDQIGQGSYGLVKLAYSEEDSTHYAMKILSKKRLLRQAGLMRRGPKKSTSPLDRVYREIAVLKKLDHPNIVKLVEVLDDPIEDSLYLVFELVKQGEVLSIPTDKPLSEERAWNVFRDCLLGLEYLHYQKIIHADLKPGNLLLTECGHVKIADLGVCNEFLGDDAIMSNGSTAGTPAFRAPETLILGQNVYCGRAADIWALGATLYSLVFGNVPFLANSIPLLYEKIKHDSIVFPTTPEISEELIHCIDRMLDKDAAHRITLPQLKVNKWVTNNGAHPLPTEDENCCLVQVDEDDINSVVRSIPKLDTLILIKTMLKNHSFGNPFMRGVSGKAPQPGGSRLERFVRAGRSNSAPGSYHVPLDRYKQSSTDNVLPSLTEHCATQYNEET